MYKRLVEILVILTHRQLVYPRQDSLSLIYGVLLNFLNITVYTSQHIFQNLGGINTPNQVATINQIYKN